MAHEEGENSPEDAMLSRLWEIAHKYQRRLARGEVVPLAESEGDRRTVEPFGQHLRSSTERALDGATYRSLSEMQVRRDSRRLLSNLPARVRLARLGFEVALRAKPVVFVHGPGQVVSGGLLACVSYAGEAVAESERPEELAEHLDESENRVRMRDVDEATLEQMRRDVKHRLLGSRFKAGGLASALTSSEADLVSQLARRGEIAIVTDGEGNVEIRQGSPRGRSAPTVAVALCPQAKGKSRG